MNTHHTTRQKGLRNRSRSGSSTYAIKQKSRRADRYGTFDLAEHEEWAGRRIAQVREARSEW